MERPICVMNEHLLYLDDLRDSGITNMFGAGIYLESEFPELSEDEAEKVLFYWMHSFGDENR